MILQFSFRRHERFRSFALYKANMMKADVETCFIYQ